MIRRRLFFFFEIRQAGEVVVIRLDLSGLQVIVFDGFFDFIILFINMCWVLKSSVFLVVSFEGDIGFCVDWSKGMEVVVGRRSKQFGQLLRVVWRWYDCVIRIVNVIGNQDGQEVIQIFLFKLIGGKKIKENFIFFRS